MALTTPISLVQRGFTANAGVTITLYPHSQMVNDSPVKTVSAYFSGPDATIVKGAAIATNDVFQLISIPAGAFVIGVAVTLITAEGGVCTFDIGDDATVDGYHNGLDGNGAIGVFSFDTDGTMTEAFGNGKFYAAANTIDLKLITGTAATVEVKLSATYIQTTPLAV